MLLAPVTNIKVSPGRQQWTSSRTTRMPSSRPILKGFAWASVQTVGTQMSKWQHSTGRNKTKKQNKIKKAHENHSTSNFKVAAKQTKWLWTTWTIPGAHWSLAWCETRFYSIFGEREPPLKPISFPKCYVFVLRSNIHFTIVNTCPNYLLPQGEGSLCPMLVKSNFLSDKISAVLRPYWVIAAWGSGGWDLPP